MNEVPELILLDLGEAKEQTRGWPPGPKPEENPTFPFRPPA